jgi:CheY-like chemotaxis protein
MSARVLIVEESLPYRRLLREALTSFRQCEVDDTPSAESAFEMALKREYALFIFALQTPPLTGDLLDRLIAKAYPLAHPGRHTAPPVIYMMRPSEVQRIYDLQRDARVRGHLTLPPRLDQLLALTQALLPAKEG